jgi:hypothetical protein
VRVGWLRAGLRWRACAWRACGRGAGTCVGRSGADSLRYSRENGAGTGCGRASGCRHRWARCPVCGRLACGRFPHESSCPWGKANVLDPSGRARRTPRCDAARPHQRRAVPGARRQLQHDPPACRRRRLDPCGARRLPDGRRTTNLGGASVQRSIGRRSRGDRIASHRRSPLGATRLPAPRSDRDHGAPPPAYARARRNHRPRVARVQPRRGDHTPRHISHRTIAHVHRPGGLWSATSPSCCERSTRSVGCALRVGSTCGERCCCTPAGAGPGSYAPARSSIADMASGYRKPISPACSWCCSTTPGSPSPSRSTGCAARAGDIGSTWPTRSG